MTTRVAYPETDYKVPAGFRWASSEAGIKYKDRLDLGVCIADQSCSSAAVFTQNRFAAAPVEFSRNALQGSGGMARGCIVNSGCANAATGKEGLRNAGAMADATASAFGFDQNKEPVLVCSTGTIGTQLPMAKIESAAKFCASAASDSVEAFDAFSRSILTTDTIKKIAFARFESKGKQVCVLGCAKGSGMMQPSMATMLAYIFTDAQVAPQVLQQCLSEATERSLNCVTVDGDTSTNDTTILMASGVSGVDVSSGETRAAFEAALLDVLQSLSRQLARDGEGATKLIEVEVSGAEDFLSARSCAFRIANSPLVKTAIYGRDANWGRIAMAIGNAGIPFSIDDVTIQLGDLTLFQGGSPQPLDEESALKVLSQEFVRIHVALGMGHEAATVWTCDLTEKYIEINGSYRT